MMMQPVVYQPRPGQVPLWQRIERLEQGVARAAVTHRVLREDVRRLRRRRDDLTVTTLTKELLSDQHPTIGGSKRVPWVYQYEKGDWPVMTYGATLEGGITQGYLRERMPAGTRDKVLRVSVQFIRNDPAKARSPTIPGGPRYWNLMMHSVIYANRRARNPNNFRWIRHVDMQMIEPVNMSSESYLEIKPNGPLVRVEVNAHSTANPYANADLSPNTATFYTQEGMPTSSCVFYVVDGQVSATTVHCAIVFFGDNFSSDNMDVQLATLREHAGTVSFEMGRVYREIAELIENQQ